MIVKLISAAFGALTIAAFVAMALFYRPPQ